jgi:hypothetical protein
MKSTFKRLIYVLLCAGTFYSGTALACHPVVDGCIGCSDDELPVCLTELVEDICNEGGGIEFCNQRRVFEDAERQVTLSTGRHFSRIRAMYRSAQKYQDPLRPR